MCGLMDVHRFHRDLLGHHKGRTPEEFWLSDTYSALYTAYEERQLRGFSSTARDPMKFAATFVLALCLTEVIHPVYLAVPKHQVTWVVGQVENVGRYIFRQRKNDKDGVLVLRRAFQQIRAIPLALGFPEPERWVMFGFQNTDPLPPWAQGQLLEHSELAAPLTGAPTPR